MCKFLLKCKKPLELTGKIVIFAVGQQDTASSESVDSKNKKRLLNQEQPLLFLSKCLCYILL